MLKLANFDLNFARTQVCVQNRKKDKYEPCGFEHAEITGNFDHSLIMNLSLLNKYRDRSARL